MLSFLVLCLLVLHQGPALDLLGRGAYSALQTPCWFFHVFGLRKDFWPFTNSIWNTKTVVWQSAWKTPCIVENLDGVLAVPQPGPRGVGVFCKLLQLNPGAWGEHLTSQLPRVAAWLLVTRFICPIYIYKNLVKVLLIEFRSFNKESKGNCFNITFVEYFEFPFWL